MNIIKEKTNTTLHVALAGRIDTVTAYDFGTQINDDLDDVKTLVLDFGGVDYVSSIGLRVILELQKTMNANGTMKITNLQPQILRIFEMTGFVNILTIV
ncbi:MAG: STAS domain-containing protein [Candidatus Gastranaerophilales bacterium]